MAKRPMSEEFHLSSTGPFTQSCKAAKSNGHREKCTSDLQPPHPLCVTRHPPQVDSVRRFLAAPLTRVPCHGDAEPGDCQHHPDQKSIIIAGLHGI
jgi:hypothetical protein